MDIDPDWRASALCAQTDPDLWFPPKGGRSDAAVRICRRCPVRTDCDAYAVANNEKFGIWAGRSRSSRGRAIRGRVRVVWDPDTGAVTVLRDAA